jgi:cytochrome c556
MAARPRDRSKNPQVENEPEEVQQLIDSNRADFNWRSHRLGDGASVAMKAVEAKDKDALVLALDGIDKACESCHLHYWYPRDKRAREAAKEDRVFE